MTDYNPDCILWATAHVDDYGHCEYDHSYIIFNRHDNNKEVWRYARDFRDSEMPEDFKSDESMIKAPACISFIPPLGVVFLCILKLMTSIHAHS
ncbi:hypothetical protein DEU56DRAFT_983933 [Suillus clintonianus]|uniref:uncharacterized protein n=1 Tax=Suillus clintonianus TaxID=1904413 RepID=UPI001B86B90E|nr:uncharacterized protein DEU56DRAFT_983933 [Suillus clintonianus]KAG2122904.1 hypothetical protein DEU56DRAFT_983933 [Suillus clintonianus]